MAILCFISLLKCALAGLFLDGNFQILDTDAVTFGAQNMLFGRLGAQFGTLGGPWGDPGTVGRTPKDTLGSRLGFLLILGGFGDPIFIVFRVPWHKMAVLFHFRLQVVSFNDFLLDSGRLRFKNKHLV